MKQFYFLFLTLLISTSFFGQLPYSENMGTPSTTTLVTSYTGWQNSSPILYSGNGDVRTSIASSGYTGASGSGNVWFSNTTPIRYFLIEGINTSAYNSNEIVLSFGYLTSNTSNHLLVEQSSNGTDWSTINYTQNTNTSWNLVTVYGGILSTTNLRLRFTQTSSSVSHRLDDVKLSLYCDLNLGTAVTVCNDSTLNLDTYNVTIPFTGGGSGTYNLAVNSGTVGGDNPSLVASGNIVISNITEGTNLTLNVTGSCTINRTVNSPECKPINTLPYYENFDYTAGQSLGGQQKWINVNSGDDVLVVSDNLSYSGLTPSGGNAVQFDGAGIDPKTPFTTTNSGLLFTSFLFKVKDFASVADGGEGYVFVLANETNTFRGRVFVKRSGTQFQIGFSETSTSAYDATLYNTNETIFVVISYDFTNTTYKLWVNPPVNSLGSTTPTFEITSAVTANLGNFYLRQDSSGNTPTIVFDELRIATEESKVLDVVKNDISGFALYPNPVKGGKVFINSANNYAERTVQVFDVLGKQVVNQKGTQNSIDVSHLNKGIYIMKVAEEGKVATRKLVIE